MPLASHRLLGREGYQHLSQTYPNAVLESSVDFMVPMVHNAPNRAKALLDRFCSWGVNRFAVSWQTLDIRQFTTEMHAWGYEVNINDVPDLATFLQSILLTPKSITSTFYFPQWSYYGQGVQVDWSIDQHLVEATNIFAN